MNLEILFEDLEKEVRVELIVEPLAPLSMVSTMPGSFYKTLSTPSKQQLCGAFENVLGWHFDENFKNALVSKSGKKEIIRSQIRKDVVKYCKKHKIDAPKWERSDVGYEPLLAHLFDIKLVVKPRMEFYKDIWKQMRKRSDGYSHPKGTMNLSYEIIPLKMDLQRKEPNGTITDDAIAAFYKENKASYPSYYSSVSNREFIIVENGDVFKMCLMMTASLFNALQAAFSENNIAYLGTNEGWVNLKIKEL
ncbi:MAG: hypothetical protein RL757_2347 [Bacteroidota bacterium]|jgi:CRISPR-associated protein Cas5